MDKKNKIAIVGGGPAGIMSAIFASENPENEIYIFDKNIILNTLLPTGGGRCNLAYSEFDFRELAKFYPRGEKFLFSVFSKFSTAETIEFFENIGVKTYTQDDMRIFPVSDSSKEVKNSLLQQIDKKNVKKMFETVLNIEKTDCSFSIKTDKGLHFFDNVIISSGGRGNGQKLAEQLGHNLIELKPALCSLVTKEKVFSILSGVSFKNVHADVFFENKKIKSLIDDFLFTHKGISGPLVYKISSYCAYLNFNEKNSLKIELNFTDKDFDYFDKDFSDELKTNSQKEIINVLNKYVSRNFALTILNNENIDSKTKAGQLTAVDRKKISKNVTEFTINAIKSVNGEEIVTAGGVDLDEINPKTMESKLIEGLYFCGEVIDIDGLTGGFNLQNCWSTGYIAGKSLS